MIDFTHVVNVTSKMLHDALDARSAKVIRTDFHDQPIDAYNWTALLCFAFNDSPSDHFRCDEVFAAAI